MNIKLVYMSNIIWKVNKVKNLFNFLFFFGVLIIEKCCKTELTEFSREDGSLTVAPRFWDFSLSATPGIKFP